MGFQENERLQYRWDDGSLRDTPPPLDPYVVAKKREWHPLVTFCRTKHGHGTYAEKGYCLKYDMNVTYEEHKEYLAAAGQPGIQPLYDENGNWYGYDPSKTDHTKMDDPSYPFRGVRVTDPNHPLADPGLVNEADKRLRVPTFFTIVTSSFAFTYFISNYV